MNIHKTDIKSIVFNNTKDLKQAKSDIAILKSTDPSSMTIHCWGDSLSQNSYEDELQTLIGEEYTVEVCGVGGETSAEIATRSGGRVIYLNNITIPATTTPVQVATYATPFRNNIDNENIRIGRRTVGIQTVNPVTIGGIEGTLSVTQTTEASTDAVWYFTRSVAGSELIINRPTAMITNAAKTYRGGIGALWIGGNGGFNGDANILINQIDSMLAIANFREYIVLAIQQASGNGTTYAPVDTALLNKYGRRFLNEREYMINYGLADAGITPTAQDNIDIADGKIPTSLRVDEIHLNAAGNLIVAQQIHERLIELGVI